MRDMYKILLAFISGILYIRWTPLTESWNLGSLLAEFVISPVRFFMASSAFLAAFWCLGDLFRESMAAVRALFNKRVEPALFFLLIIACMFFVFSMMNNVLAILLFSFSAVYGMISLEKKRVRG